MIRWQFSVVDWAFSMSRWVNFLVNEKKITGCLFDLGVRTVFHNHMEADILKQLNSFHFKKPVTWYSFLSKSVVVFVVVTLDSRINIGVRLLIFGFFSRVYVLINVFQFWNRLKICITSFVIINPGGYIYLFKGLCLFPGLGLFWTQYEYQINKSPILSIQNYISATTS